MNGVPSGWVIGVDRDLALLHAFEQRRLRLGGGAVDLVAQHDVGEDRAGPELEVALLLVEDVDAGDVGGQQVGRELDVGGTSSRSSARSPWPAWSCRRRARPRSAGVPRRSGRRGPAGSQRACPARPARRWSRSPGTGPRTAASPGDAREPPPGHPSTCDRPTRAGTDPLRKRPGHRTPHPRERNPGRHRGIAAQQGCRGGGGKFPQARLPSEPRRHGVRAAVRPQRGRPARPLFATPGITPGRSAAVAEQITPL